MKSCIVIPARLKSTRLPEKVLADIHGKSMIQRVYEQCIQSDIQDVFIICDHLKILKHCQLFTENVWLSSENCQSGTERIVESVDKLSAYDWVINVQGDEPLIDVAVINQLNKAMKQSDAPIGTCIKKCDSYSEFINPNKVKVVKNIHNRAIYFSRSPIPFPMNHEDRLPDSAYLHIGIYAYQLNFLQNFYNLNASKLENIERLEQLRFLENNVAIQMVEVDYESFAVDTLEDLENVRKMISSEGEK